MNVSYLLYYFDIDDHRHHGNQFIKTTIGCNESKHLLIILGDQINLITLEVFKSICEFSAGITIMAIISFINTTITINLRNPTNTMIKTPHNCRQSTSCLTRPPSDSARAQRTQGGGAPVTKAGEAQSLKVGFYVHLFSFLLLLPFTSAWSVLLLTTRLEVDPKLLHFHHSLNSQFASCHIKNKAAIISSSNK